MKTLIFPDLRLVRWSQISDESPHSAILRNVPSLPPAPLCRSQHKYLWHFRNERVTGNAPTFVGNHGRWSSLS